MFILFVLGVCVIPILAKNETITNSEGADVYFPPENWSDTFDWQLLKAVAPQSGNVIISPISLKLVLALLYEASSGTTEREFQHVLQFPIDKKQLRDSFTDILEALQPTERSQYVLNLGTRIFLDTALTPQQKFAEKALNNYRTNIEPANFSNPIEATKTINSWIEKVTNGKIPEISRPDDIHDTVMVIGNAVYFKGTWRQQFLKNQTEKGGFYVTPNKTVEVDYIKTTDRFFYGESMNLDAKILRLPYQGKRYSFFVILPNSKAGLPELIKKVNLQAIKYELYTLDEQLVEVALPKFKFDFKTEYSKILQEFGLHQMFQNTASFPGIASGRPNLLREIVVSSIIQKSGLAVDEEGSVVYSATNVHIGNKFGEADNVFNATHPFMFFIEEQTKGTILFVGKVENPAAGEAKPLPTNLDQQQNVGLTDNQRPVQSIAPIQQNNPENLSVMKRLNYFDLELLKEFTETGGNVFISPASIKTTLAMILEGARGTCADEIGNALRIHNINDKNVRQTLSKLIFDLNEHAPNTVLETTNSVFVSNKYKVLPDYQSKLNEYYKATIQNIDFSKPANAANFINNWAYNATHGLIREIVGPQNIFDDTNIVLANALFFKGKWKTAFDVKSTRIKCFQSATRGCVNTPMMQVIEIFNYSRIPELNADAVEIPYQDDKYSMLILMPSGKNNIVSLARDLQHANFESVVNQLRPDDLILEIPKFELEYNVDLIPYLISLRITEIFGTKANLSGIIAKESVKINNIVHKTRIEVNEQGTKAAAASTAIVIPLMGIQNLIIDRPFLFFIYHKESKNIIFEGILGEPAEVVKPVLGKTIGQRYYVQHN